MARARGRQVRADRAVTAENGNEHPDVARIAEVEAANRGAERRAMVAQAAYFRAEQRGFSPGHELEDWLAAEIEVGNALQLTAVSPGEETALRRVS